MNQLSAEEQAAATVVASLAGKRDREDSADAAGGVKRHCETLPAVENEELQPLPNPPVVHRDEENQQEVDPSEDLEGELKPPPFYCYKDFSTMPDPDTLTPLTAPGRVPNFPAKMHAILSRSDLSEIVCWMPHGRAWKVLKSREFEVRVIPTYFEHAKFSSFIRQANGWGFRRLTHGRDRNCYYHPLFLRALPHLCKEMKRPGVAKKLAADPEHEPDLYAISELHPVPTHFDDESILLHCTVQGGPKARMPIYSGSLSYSSTSSSLKDLFLKPDESKKAAAASIVAPTLTQLTPRDHEALSGFQTSLNASELCTSKPPAVNVSIDSGATMNTGPVNVGQAQTEFTTPAVTPPQVFASPGITAATILPPNSVSAGVNKVSTLAAANQLAFGAPHSFVAAFQASSAASQFAAGFAAAAALSHQQFQNMIHAMQQHQQTATPSDNNSFFSPLPPH